MSKSDNARSEYLEAVGIYREVKLTCPTRRGNNRNRTDQWNGSMNAVRTSAKARVVDYVIALLREDAAKHGIITSFNPRTRLSECLEPGVLAKLVADIRELGDDGHRWIEDVVSREMTMDSSLPLGLQVITLDGNVDLIVVRMGSSRDDNFHREARLRARV